MFFLSRLDNPLAAQGRRGRKYFLPLLLLALAGCQHLSHPFEDEHAPPDAAILAVRDTVGITVAPATGAPEASAKALAEAMAAALRDAEVPATTGTGNKHSYQLAADATADVAPGGADHVRIRWTMRSSDGKEIGHADQEATLSAADWAGGGGAKLQDLAKAEAPALIAFVTEPPAVEHKPMQQVFVAQVTGAPGDGNRALPSALSYLLKRKGVPLVPDTATPGTITIAGTVSVTAVDAANDRVQIAWHVLNPAGADIGQIAQDNTVPHGTLDGRWGEVAMAVAMAGVDDVLRVAGTIPPA